MPEEEDIGRALARRWLLPRILEALERPPLHETLFVDRRKKEVGKNVGKSES